MVNAQELEAHLRGSLSCTDQSLQIGGTGARCLGHIRSGKRWCYLVLFQLGIRSYSHWLQLHLKNPAIRELSSQLQRCDNEECLAALGTRPYLKVGKVRKLCHIFEIFCIYCNWESLDSNPLTVWKFQFCFNSKIQIAYSRYSSFDNLQTVIAKANNWAE